MLVRDLMTDDPVRIPESRSIREAENLMREYDMRHVPVVNGRGDLVGILSDRDLRSYMPFDAQQGIPDLEAIEKRSNPVTVAMQPSPIYVSPEDEVPTVIDLMVEWKIGAVPVVEAGSEQLVGIVSYIDVLRAARPSL
jgi:CBS domain-containing protein